MQLFNIVNLRTHGRYNHFYYQKRIIKCGLFGDINCVMLHLIILKEFSRAIKYKHPTISFPNPMLFKTIETPHSCYGGMMKKITLVCSASITVIIWCCRAKKTKPYIPSFCVQTVITVSATAWNETFTECRKHQTLNNLPTSNEQGTTESIIIISYKLPLICLMVKHSGRRTSWNKISLVTCLV